MTAASEVMLRQPPVLQCTYQEKYVYDARFKGDASVEIWNQQPAYKIESIKTDKIYHETSGKYFNQLKEQEIKAAFNQLNNDNIKLILTCDPGSNIGNNELQFVIQRQENKDSK